jgi:hypothetical protein
MTTGATGAFDQVPPYPQPAAAPAPADQPPPAAPGGFKLDDL